MRSPSKSSSVVFNGLVEVYCKLGDTRTAKWVFDQISMKNLDSKTCILGIYCFWVRQKMRKEKPLSNFFPRWKNDGVRPNWSTFVGVITACDCFGAVDEGFQHFESVTRDYDINSTLEHFLGIVDLYGRLQKIAEAREFIRNMQIDASSVVWETLEKYAQTEPGLLLGEPSSSLRLSNKKKVREIPI